MFVTNLKRSIVLDKCIDSIITVSPFTSILNELLRYFVGFSIPLNQDLVTRSQ
jgi:hypothetical protein